MYRITRCLSVGPFVSAADAAGLRECGVTHILNVSDLPSELTANHGEFQEVIWVPLDDYTRLPFPILARALDTLHALASAPDAHVYIHCLAASLRSPTLLWLYLIAIGVAPEDARKLIKRRVPGATIGHRRMVDHEHILFAQERGQSHFFPLPRPEVIVPFSITEGE